MPTLPAVQVLAKEGSAAQPLRPLAGSTAGGRRRKAPVRASKDPGGRVRHGPQGGLLPTAGRAHGVDLGRKASTQLTCYFMGLSAQPFILDVGALHSVHLIQSTTWTALLPRAPQCGQSSRAPSRSVFTAHWMPLFSVTAWAASLQKLQDLRAGDRGAQTAAKFPVHHTFPACAGASRRDRAWSGSLIDEQCVQLRRTNLCHCRFCASCIGLCTICLHYHINRAGSKRCPPPAGKVEAYAGHLQAPFVIW